MKLKIVILAILFFGCSPKETVEEIQLVSEYKLKEKYRVTKTEYDYNENDSLRSTRNYFRAFDSKNRIINENNMVFYEYNALGKIDTKKSIYRRDLTVKVNTVKFVYDENQNLNYIIRLNETLDTILTNRFNPKGKLSESKSKLETTHYAYNKDVLTQKTITRNGIESRVSNYTYDSLGRLVINDWIFSGINKMKTTFKYDEKNRLKEEIDSSYSIKSNPNSYVEFKTEYKYNESDSIVEIAKLGRVVSEREFKLRSKTVIEYKNE